MPRLAARTFPRISGNPRGGNGAGGGGGMSRVARNDESVPPRFDARAPGAIAIGIRASTGTDLRAKHLREKAMTGISPPLPPSLLLAPPPPLPPSISRPSPSRLCVAKTSESPPPLPTLSSPPPPPPDERFRAGSLPRRGAISFSSSLRSRRRRRDTL